VLQFRGSWASNGSGAGKADLPPRQLSPGLLGPIPSSRRFCLVAELVDEQPHHVLRDPVVEPVRAKPEFVEDQFAAGAVGRAAQMMRCRATWGPTAIRHKLLVKVLEATTVRA
jgi:hypothetical protein